MQEPAHKLVQWIFAVLTAVLSMNSGAIAQEPALQADVVVVSGTPGGIAAAVAAARQGRTVILCEATGHVGGIVGSGLTNVDLLKQTAVGGIFQQFIEKIRSHYRTTYGPDSPQVKESRNGFHFEPRVAEAAFVSLLDGEKARLRVLYRHQLARAVVEQNRVTAAVFDDLAAKRQVTIIAKVFIDATYEGDLAAMAGVACRVGRESREEFNEKHAGEIYARFGKDEFLPGSTGQGDAGIQGFCFRFTMTRVAANRVPVVKPDGYNRDDYKHLLADIKAGKITTMRHAMQMWPLPNDRIEINSENPSPSTGIPSESHDLAEENWRWPEASYAEREKIFKRIWSYNEGLVWFLQNDEEVPKKLRDECGQWGFCKDEFTDNNYRPWQVYVRQGRRIMGEYRLTENDGNPDPELKRTKIQPTSIAIAEYPFDSHGVHKYDPAHPGVREGYIYIHHPPIQLPYGIVVPQKIDGLLVPVACSATHVGYQTIRMEPVFMALGQAAGTAASLAISENTTVRAVNVEKMQRRIVEDGAVITYYSDLPLNHPDFAAFQFLGARGLNPAYTATPEKKLTRADAWKKLARIFSNSGMRWPALEGEGTEPIKVKELVGWLTNAGMAPNLGMTTAAPDDSCTVSDLARTTYVAWFSQPRSGEKK